MNRPLLHRLLEQLRVCNCSPILVNCHHLAAQMEAALTGRPGVLLQVEPDILGTGGGLRKALNRMDNDPILVMNGDLYHDIDLEKVYHQHLRSPNDVTLAVHDYQRFNTVGVNGDRVRDFTGQEGERLAFTGIHVVDPEVIEMIPEQCFHHIIDLYQDLAGQGRVGYCRVDGALWRDIGTPQDYLQLHAELLAAGQQPPGWVIDPTARLGEAVVLADWGCIGPGAVIGDRARLCRSVVWGGADVAAGSRYCDAIVTGNPAIDAAACPAAEQCL